MRTPDRKDFFYLAEDDAEHLRASDQVSFTAEWVRESTPKAFYSKETDSRAVREQRDIDEAFTERVLSHPAFLHSLADMVHAGIQCTCPIRDQRGPADAIDSLNRNAWRSFAKESGLDREAQCAFLEELTGTYNRALKGAQRHDHEAKTHFATGLMGRPKQQPVELLPETLEAAKRYRAEHAFIARRINGSLVAAAVKKPGMKDIVSHAIETGSEGKSPEETMGLMLGAFISSAARTAMGRPYYDSISSRDAVALSVGTALRSQASYWPSGRTRQDSVDHLHEAAAESAAREGTVVTDSFPAAPGPSTPEASPRGRPPAAVSVGGGESQENGRRREPEAGGGLPKAPPGAPPAVDLGDPTPEEILAINDELRITEPMAGEQEEITPLEATEDPSRPVAGSVESMPFERVVGDKLR